MVGAPFRELSTCLPTYWGAWFRRGEVPSPNGLGAPTPTLRYDSLSIDKFTAPWDHFLLFKTDSKNLFEKEKTYSKVNVYVKSLEQ